MLNFTKRYKCPADCKTRDIPDQDNGPGPLGLDIKMHRNLLLFGMRALLFSWPSLLITSCEPSSAAQREDNKVHEQSPDTTQRQPESVPSVIDTQLYNKLMLQLAHNKDSSLWPVPSPLPSYGALLPFHRIVAYYGNLYSTRMGILGELPAPEMLERLQEEVKHWQEADTTIKVIPALHYIAVTAQRDPGKAKMYRLRMPDAQIDKVIEMAARINALVFLDIQVGHSTLQEEIPLLKKYLMMPNVHLGIDPEYAMHGATVPGDRVGTFDAEDINYASDYLSSLVQENHLKPKVLVVHRFKKGMVTNYKKIKTYADVQIVMNMDGFGSRGKKLTTYKYSITNEPVQFAGFKIFYKNDIADPAWINIMQPAEVLSLYPVPVYIQYQ